MLCKYWMYVCITTLALQIKESHLGCLPFLCQLNDFDLNKCIYYLIIGSWMFEYFKGLPGIFCHTGSDVCNFLILS